MTLEQLPDVLSDDYLEPAMAALVALIPADTIDQIKSKVREALDLTIHSEKFSGQQVKDFEEDVSMRVGIHAGYHLAQRILPGV